MPNDEHQVGEGTIYYPRVHVELMRARTHARLISDVHRRTLAVLPAQNIAGFFSSIGVFESRQARRLVVSGL